MNKLGTVHSTLRHEDDIVQTEADLSDTFCSRTAPVLLSCRCEGAQLLTYAARMGGARQDGHQDLYGIVDRWVGECLKGDDSLFTPGVPVWTTANLQDLKDRFVDSPDEGPDRFEDKFQRQLDGASDGVLQVAAELLYVHFLPAADFTPPAKRRLIDLVLSWMGAPVPIPTELVDALRVGLLNTGQGYRQWRPHQLWFLIEAALALKLLDASERDAVLVDPWQTKAQLWSLPVRAAYLTRNILLHLLHPEVFEDIASRTHKAAIAAHYADLTTETDEDRALAEIRTRLEEGSDRHFSFYAPEVRAQWDPTERPRRAWLVRGANVHGRNLVPRWTSEGFCSIGWLEIGEVEPGVSKQEIVERLRKVTPEATESSLRLGATQIHKFANEIVEGDYIVTVEEKRVLVGEVITPVEWVTYDADEVDSSTAEVEVCPRRHGVRWTDASVIRTDLSPEFTSKLKTLITVSDLTRVISEIEGRIMGAGLPAEVPVELDSSTTLRAPTPDLAVELHLPLPWLNELVDDLREKRQVILFGPPGTGKTYVATKLAEALVDDPADTQLIQFHPSYAYEDFFEGFRPVAAGEGQVAFELVPGPLKLLASEAEANPGRNYILIIDEINRANLAKVFGELYFALEYREVAIRLQYSPGQPFTLPKNLYLIGTMNTSDRSIALVDAAMRRRFYFIRVAPEEEPIRGLLARWLDSRGWPLLAARLLDELNEAIEDPDAAIGPSYFMTEAARTEEGLRKIWRRSIIPLLEEHYLGTGRDVRSEFGYDALLGRTGR